MGEILMDKSSPETPDKQPEPLLRFIGIGKRGPIDGAEDHDSRLYANKAELRQILEEQDKKTGFVVDPTATAQQARAIMIAQGIRPEDNEFSSEIRRTRDRK